MLHISDSDIRAEQQRQDEEHTVRPAWSSCRLVKVEAVRCGQFPWKPYAVHGHLMSTYSPGKHGNELTSLRTDELVKTVSRWSVFRIWETALSVYYSTTSHHRKLSVHLRVSEWFSGIAQAFVMRHRSSCSGRSQCFPNAPVPDQFWRQLPHRR